MKVLFMGTPDIARESLEKMYENNIDICGIVTVPDRPAGRGKKLAVSPVKEFAVEKGIKLFQPEKISNNTEFKTEIKNIAPDLVVVVSYGVILPKSFLEIPKLGCINLHPSMLPKYRGAAPIQWAILNGDKTTGVTIMYLDEGMDSGDIIIQKEVAIDPDETTGDLWTRLSKLGAEMLVSVIKDIENGQVTRTKQPDNYTLAPMLKKEMAKIDWANQSALEIKNLVRGLNPIMGAYSILDGKKIKLWKVDIIDLEKWSDVCSKYSIQNDSSMPAGTILFASDKSGLFIKASDGIISVQEIQGENARKMSVLDYLRGNKLEAGKVLV